MKLFWNCQGVSQKFPNVLLDTNWEILRFGAAGLGTYSKDSQWDLGYSPEKCYTYKTLESI